MGLFMIAYSWFLLCYSSNNTCLLNRVIMSHTFSIIFSMVESKTIFCHLLVLFVLCYFSPLFLTSFDLSIILLFLHYRLMCHTSLLCFLMVSLRFTIYAYLRDVMGLVLITAMKENIEIKQVTQIFPNT